MASNHDDQSSIRRYLLNQLTDDAQQQIEQRLLTDDELLDQIQATEDELIDEYLTGALSKDEAEMFEKHFLATAERQQKLRFAKVFRRYVATHASDHPQKNSDQARISWGWRNFVSAYPLRVAAFAALILVAALGVWRIFFYQSDVDKGLIALNAAYREQRLVEARITLLDYAPFLTTRGELERVDSPERDYAQRYLIDAVRDHPGAASYHALGKSYLANREFDKAIAWFETALKVDANNAQIYSDLGAAYLEKGKLELEQGKSDRASSEAGKGLEDLGRSLENLNRALELNPNLLEALFNRALCYRYLMLPDQAANDWREYLKKDSTSQWADEARRNLSRLEEQKDETSQTKEKLLQEFLNAYQTRSDEGAWLSISRSRARTGNLIVEALLDDYLSLTLTGRTNEAESQLRMISYAGKLEQDKVADLYTSDLARFYNSVSPTEHASLQAARTLLKTARGRYDVGEFDEALEIYSQARDSFAAIGDECEVLFSESWIGNCQLRTLSAEQGIHRFETLEQTFEKRRYLSLAAQALQALGEAQSSLNELSKTLEYANRALKLSEEVQDDANTVRCLTQLLATYLALGDYRRSLEFFVRATSLAETLPHTPTLIWPAYYEVGLAFHLLRLSVPAVAFEEEALRLANVANVPLLRSRSWERLGLLHAEQKRFEEAIADGERALAEAQSIAGKRSKTTMQAHSMLRLGRFNMEAGNLPQALVYFDKSLALYQKLDSKLYLYEAHKGKLLADIRLKDDSAADTELPTVISLLEQNREKITEESNRDRFFDAGQDTYDIAIDFAHSRKRNEEQAFDYAEDSRARSLFEMISTGSLLINRDREGPEINLDSKSKPLPLSEIRNRLPEQAQILEYAVIDDKVVMWLVTRSGIKSAETFINAADLESQTRNFAYSLSHPTQTNPDAIYQVARDLHTSLISPIERYLDQKLLLCIVADKSLNYLPFEALVSESTGRYLIEDYRLERAPSATIFIGLTQQAKNRGRITNERLLSVGNPSFDRTEFASLPNLPAAAREAEQIATLYYPETHLIGEAATTDRVKHSLVDAEVIHLATHAVLDERSPLLSRLLTAHEASVSARSSGSSGVLPAAEIYGMSLPRARLVVLSACQTGIEHAYRGEGAIGLARPFAAAGVPLVIASLWPVDSEATADLMISFHKHRKQDHVSTVEALHRAELEFLYNQQPNLGKNYGWAAFVAIGGYAVF